jgi:rubrerythrin
MYSPANMPNFSQMFPEQNMLLNLIIEAMKDERADRAKYKTMIDMSKSDKVRKQIEFAFNDEGKHYKMFQQIYYILTGQYMDIPMPEPKKSEKFIEAIESSINGELEAVELYRKIRSMLANTQLRDMLFEIITDEQEHATRFVYLYSMEK